MTRGRLFSLSRTLWLFATALPRKKKWKKEEEIVVVLPSVGIYAASQPTSELSRNPKKERKTGLVITWSQSEEPNGSVEGRKKSFPRTCRKRKKRGRERKKDSLVDRRTDGLTDSQSVWAACKRNLANYLKEGRRSHCSMADSSSSIRRSSFSAWFLVLPWSLSLANEVKRKSWIYKLQTASSQPTKLSFPFLWSYNDLNIRKFSDESIVNFQ